MTGSMSPALWRRTLRAVRIDGTAGGGKIESLGENRLTVAADRKGHRRAPFRRYVTRQRRCINEHTHRPIVRRQPDFLYLEAALAVFKHGPAPDFAAGEMAHIPRITDGEPKTGDDHQNE